MKLIGKLTGVFRDAKTGEITKVMESNNHLQDIYLQDKIAGNANPLSLGTYLFISSDNPGRQTYDYDEFVPNCIMRDTDLGETVEYDNLANAHLIQKLQRFNQPAADFTINIAGISATFSGSPTVRAKDPSAVVWFETPCVFLTTETLDLFYRVYVTFDPNWKTAAADSMLLTRYEAELLTKFLSTSLTAFDFLVDETAAALSCIPNSKINTRQLDYINGAVPEHVIDPTTRVAVLEPTWFRRGQTLSMDLNDEVGKLIGCIGQTNSSMLSKVHIPGTSSLQGLFGHREIATGPFYDATTSQISAGQLGVDAASWTDPDYPKLVKVNVLTDGLTGTSDYKFQIRNQFGFYGNSYANRAYPIQSTVFSNKHIVGGMAVSRDDYSAAITSELAAAVATPTFYSNKEVLFLWNDEISFVNVITGVGETFDNTTLVGLDVIPRFLATDICKAETMPDNTVYVACRNSGIYKFSPDRQTLTHINSATTGLTGVTGCYGFAVGNAGRLWAYFGHTTTPGLYFSDDAGATWSDAGMVDTVLSNNPERILAMDADPSDVGGNVGFFYSEDATSTVTSIRWWDHALTTVSAGPTNVFNWTILAAITPIRRVAGQNHTLQDMLQCSPDDGQWAFAHRRISSSGATPPTVAFLTFGTNTITDTATLDISTNGLTLAWVKNALGADALLFMTIDAHTANNVTDTGSHVVLLSPDLSFENYDINGADNTRPSGDFSALYLGDGVWLNAFVHPGTTAGANNANANYFYLVSCVPTTVTYTGIEGIIAEVFPEYGWNGSAWVKGNAGKKLTHAAAEELIDGVTLAWDDNTGVDQFRINDHYTFGLYDGVLMDGSTSFDFTFESYLKPTKRETDVEFTTLSATTKVSNITVPFQTNSVADYQDLASTDTNDVTGEIQGTGTGLEGDYNAGGRSLNPAIRGDAAAALPNNVIVPDSATGITNAQGWIEFSIDMDNLFHVEAYVGLSSSVVLGTALNVNQIQYGFHFDSVTPGNGPGTMTVSVVESGAVRATVTDVPYDTSTIPTAFFRIVLRASGAMAYEYKNVSEGTWIEIYQTPAATVTVQDYYLDFQYVPRINYGFWGVIFNYLDTANAGHYAYLGSVTPTGLFSDEFYGIDPDYIDVTINGSLAANIGNNDSTTPLTAGFYSLFPNAGVIRYSADNVGHSLSAEYTTITKS